MACCIDALQQSLSIVYIDMICIPRGIELYNFMYEHSSLLKLYTEYGYFTVVLYPVSIVRITMSGNCHFCGVYYIAGMYIFCGICIHNFNFRVQLTKAHRSAYLPE